MHTAHTHTQHARERPGASFMWRRETMHRLSSTTQLTVGCRWIFSSERSPYPLSLSPVNHSDTRPSCLPVRPCTCKSTESASVRASYASLWWEDVVCRRLGITSQDCRRPSTSSVKRSIISITLNSYVGGCQFKSQELPMDPLTFKRIQQTQEV